MGVDNTIKVGSDFSGVGAFDQALIRLGVNYKTVFACDMDKYARQTYILNYGDLAYFPENVYDRKIPDESLDIFMTSPPCQSFSLAGKREGENSDKGILFYNSLEFIKKNKPRYFIFENVKGLLSDDNGNTFAKWCAYLGGKSHNGNQTVFHLDGSVPYHLYTKVLNAKHYGVPQNRERIFLIGIRDDKDNNFTWPKPFHLEKRIKDVLEDNVDDKYYLSEKIIKGFSNQNNSFNGKFAPITDLDGVSFALTARYYKMGRTDPYIQVRSATKKGFEIAKEGDSINLSQPNSKTRRGIVSKGVAQTLYCACNQAVYIGAFRGRNPKNKSSRNTGDKMVQTLEINKKGTSNTITSVQKDNVVIQVNTSIDTGCGRPGYLQEKSIRRLTPREAFRLMDFPDTFRFDVSDTQAYKQAGNSIVVNVLALILEKLIQ